MKYNNYEINCVRSPCGAAGYTVAGDHVSSIVTAYCGLSDGCAEAPGAKWGDEFSCPAAAHCGYLKAFEVADDSGLELDWCGVPGVDAAEEEIKKIAGGDPFNG